MPITREVVVYAVGSTILCWAYNCRDSQETCLTGETNVGVFFGEAVTERQHAPLRAALDELAECLQRAGATVGRVVFADAGSPEVEVPAA
jgi:DNA/RNA-binding domain of Phe-tRNA-synthetase-like protein